MPKHYSNDFIINGKIVDSLRVVELREELDKLGLSKSGTKKELQDKIKLYLTNQKDNFCSDQVEKDGSNLKSSNSSDIVQMYLKKQQSVLAKRQECSTPPSDKTPDQSLDEATSTNGRLHPRSSEESQSTTIVHDTEKSFDLPSDHQGQNTEMCEEAASFGEQNCSAVIVADTDISQVNEESKEITSSETQISDEVAEVCTETADIPVATESEQEEAVDVVSVDERSQVVSSSSIRDGEQTDKKYQDDVEDEDGSVLETDVWQEDAEFWNVPVSDDVDDKDIKHNKSSERISSNMASYDSHVTSSSSRLDDAMKVDADNTPIKNQRRKLHRSHTHAHVDSCNRRLSESAKSPEIKKTSKLDNSQSCHKPIMFNYQSIQEVKSGFRKIGSLKRSRSRNDELSRDKESKRSALSSSDQPVSFNVSSESLKELVRLPEISCANSNEIQPSHNSLMETLEPGHLQQSAETSLTEFPEPIVEEADLSAETPRGESPRHDVFITEHVSLSKPRIPSKERQVYTDASSDSKSKISPKVRQSSAHSRDDTRIVTHRKHRTHHKEMERSASPEASDTIYIRNLVRPFTLNQLRELLSRTGVIVDFWINNIKSHCLCQYKTADQASEALHALHNVVWPDSNPKRLNVKFSDSETLNKHRTETDTTITSSGDYRQRAFERFGLVEFATREQEEKNSKRAAKHRNEIVREWDKVKIGEKSPGEKERQVLIEKISSRNNTCEDGKHFEVSRRKSRDNRDVSINEMKENERRVGNRRVEKDEDPVEAETSEVMPVKHLDDLFRKTTATPAIYWLPLTESEFSERQAGRLQRLLERRKRNEELRRNAANTAQSTTKHL